jgi:uncharacterized protein (DUF2267 family)
MIDYAGFVATVQERGEVPREEAEQVSCVTLRTLSERITQGEAEDLAERLPAELRSCVDTDHAPEKFHVDEFLRRVAERAGVDSSHAEHDVGAVLVALYRAVGPDEFRDMRAQLPKDFDPLLDEAVRQAPSGAFDAPEPDGRMAADQFLGRVAERAGIDRDRAERATAAVLEELAIRVSGGQIEDLERRLPRALRPPLERGLSRGRGGAQPVSLDAFLDDVARKERSDRSAATHHARAVLTTLREAVGEDEWRDTVAQLPTDYSALWKPELLD